MESYHVALCTAEVSQSLWGAFSLVPRSPCQAFVTLNTKGGGRPGRIYHVMRAAADVT